MFDGMTYSEYLDEWIEIKKKKVKPATVATYLSHIEFQIKPALGKYRTEEIDDEILQECVLEWSMNGNRQTKDGLATKSIKDICTIVKSTIKTYRCKMGLPSVDFSDVCIPDDENTFVDPFSNSDSMKIIRNVFLNVGHKQRLVAIALGLLAGMRIGEICALRWKDILTDGAIKTIKVGNTMQRLYMPKREGQKTVIIEESPKSKSSHRSIPISNTLLMILAMIKPEEQVDPDSYVLTNSSIRIEPRAVRRMYADFLSSIGVEFKKFHNLRHTFATKWIACGLDVKSLSEILGHSSVVITMNIYCHPTIEDKKNWMDRFDSSMAML